MFRHFLRKAPEHETTAETTFPDVISNEALLQKLASGEDITILDVREPAEYCFQRIPGAISIPLGELEDRLGQLQQDQIHYVICRTGTRSDMACQLLAERGFSKVRNVVPGMSEWTGPVTEGVK